MTLKQLALRIRRFPAAPPVTVQLEKALEKRGTLKPTRWYKTQKEHWTGWLRGYEGPGYYGRKNWNRTAEYVYNHINCPPMVLWLGEASGIPVNKVRAAKRAALKADSAFPAQCSAIRNIIPWELVKSPSVLKPKGAPPKRKPSRTAR
jgi:hypothetical protein